MWSLKTSVAQVSATHYSTNKINICIPCSVRVTAEAGDRGEERIASSSVRSLVYNSKTIDELSLCTAERAQL
jgi:hypothetical protein